jgi:hypothetical protein
LLSFVNSSPGKRRSIVVSVECAIADWVLSHNSSHVYSLELFHAHGSRLVPQFHHGPSPYPKPTNSEALRIIHWTPSSLGFLPILWGPEQWNYNLPTSKVSVKLLLVFGDIFACSLHRTLFHLQSSCKLLFHW